MAVNKQMAVKKKKQPALKKKTQAKPRPEPRPKAKATGRVKIATFNINGVRSRLPQLCDVWRYSWIHKVKVLKRQKVEAA